MASVCRIIGGVLSYFAVNMSLADFQDYEMGSKFYLGGVYYGIC